MGLWDFIKGLFRALVFWIWNRITHAFRAKPKPAPAGRPQLHQPYHYIPGQGWVPSGGNLISRGMRRVRDYARGQSYQQPLPDYMGPVYTVQHPRAYSREYFANNMDFYMRHSPYRSRLDNLYQNNSLIYERSKFKYQGQKDKYET